MYLSKYFIPVLKEPPVESRGTISHELMLRAGLIRQQAAGLYTWLPLGLKVIRNIEAIIRQNMEEAGAIELLMPCIQSADLWIESERFENYGKEMLKFYDRNENLLLFGPTNEDVITDVFRNNIHSYKDLPKNFYHIQWKFRDEIRPRFGVMRAREFLMKDAYSFDINEENAINSYYQMYKTYMKIFQDMGLSAIPVLADNGPIGGKMSHEFHIVADSGESTIYYEKKFATLAINLATDIEQIRGLYAVEEEKYDPATSPVPFKELKVSKSIEVGHIFHIGTRYSKLMRAAVQNKEGHKDFVHMSSYGIGVTRLVAALIETNNDKKGIIWPVSVAPFKVSIINLSIKNTKCNTMADQIYQYLKALGIDVLYDDTDQRAGSKFATHDLIGSPWQIIIGEKKANIDLVELKHRATGECWDTKLDEAIGRVVGYLNVK